jgi:hypothetical protein
VQVRRLAVHVDLFLNQYPRSGTLREVSFGGKELAWISEMRPHAAKGKFGGADEGEQELLHMIVYG